MGCTSDNDRAACAIGVMAKAPRPGFSKTRLCPPLDPVQAAALSAAFLRDITENIASAAQFSPIAGYIAYAPAGQEALFDGHLAAGTDLLLADGSPPMPPDVQGFGRCLLHAILAMFARGHQAAVVLNSDSPTLPTSVLVRTAALLQAEGDRVVLGPAEDGGYYLLGMKAAHAHLFADIAWSTDAVAETTRRRAAALGLELVELPMWYDVDDAASLIRLLEQTAGFGGIPNVGRPPSPSASWPGLARPPGTSGAAPSKVPGDRAKPGHDEWANPAHQTPYPDAHGAAPGHDARDDSTHQTSNLIPYPAPFTARALAAMGLYAAALDLAAE